MNSHCSETSAPVIEALERDRARRGRRFVRFAAAMEAAPPPMAQILAAPAATPNAGRTDLRRRPVRGLAWWGIGSCAVICGVLFLSLLLERDRDAIDASVGQKDQATVRATASDLREAGSRKGDRRPGPSELPPAREEAVAIQLRK